MSGSTARIERALTAAIETAAENGCPPRLAAALRYAVFPGGARVRPRLCLAVARACGEDDPRVIDGAAAAIELLHCASLVHDDLPCFDDAATRRGKPSVHCEYNEPLAVLAGDGLILLAFKTIARSAAHRPERLAALVETITEGVGAPNGLVAGQAWEQEPQVPLALYHHAKTASLFIAAVVAGAQSAGAPSAPWYRLGERLGRAYQVADDIRDTAGDPLDLGKPTGRDVVLARPSACRELGLDSARAYFDELIADAVGAVPDGVPGTRALRALIRAEAERLVPQELPRRAA